MNRTDFITKKSKLDIRRKRNVGNEDYCQKCYVSHFVCTCPYPNKKIVKMYYARKKKAELRGIPNFCNGCYYYKNECICGKEEFNLIKPMIIQHRLDARQSRIEVDSVDKGLARLFLYNGDIKNEILIEIVDRNKLIISFLDA